MLLVNSTTLRYLKLKYYAPKCNSKNLRILCKNAGEWACSSRSKSDCNCTNQNLIRPPGMWFILEFVVVNIKPHYFVTLINSLFDEFYDKRGRALVNQTVMDKYKNQQRVNHDNANFPSTSYSQDNYFDLPSNTNYNNQFSNQFTSPSSFSQSRPGFMSPSSPTGDLVIPSIMSSSSKLGSTAARRPKKKQLRSSLSSSLAAKTASDSFGRPDWESNQETAPFLNELPELDLEGPTFPSSSSTLTAERKASKLREFRRLASARERKDKPSSTFGATANESSLTTENAFEAFPMNQSDDEWK